jgi:hypothetical protein
MPPAADIPANTSSASKKAHVDDVDDDAQESIAPTISAPSIVPPVAEALKVSA